MKKLLLSSLLMGSLFGFSQNQYTGYSSDNYAGYTASYIQPASIVNSVTRLSITSSLNFGSNNNYSGRNASLFSNAFGNENFRYRDHSSRGYQSRNFSLDLIGVSYEINHENAIGYSLRTRSFGNLDGLSNEWTDAIFNNYDSTKVQFAGFDKYSYNQFIFNEHRFNYARVIHEEGQHFLKGGVALKLINGIDATYLYAKEGEMEFISQNGSTANYENVAFEYGRAEKENMFSSRRLGFGFDLGAVYEYRPNYDEFKYDMDGETNIERYDKNKYKFKIGVSITDIGRVRFSKDTSSYDFTTNNTIQNSDDLGELSSFNFGVGNVSLFQSFDNLAANSVKSEDNKEKFNMNLPTSFNIQADYNIWKNFYVAYNSSTSIKLRSDANKVHMKAIHSIIPRYETGKVSVAVPFTVQRNAQFNVGIAGRYSFSEGKFNLFAGSQNITHFFGKRSRYNSNFFAGIGYSLRYSVPSDVDGDKVSDAKDDCMYDPGLLSLRGCPDTDGDGIPDKDDYCIYSPGPKEHQGCPDSDGDGVIDLNDQCPEDAGLAIHYGCPDRDKDGVIDVADRCPDVPGIEFNNGCPFENPGCCTDNDGDGVTNSVDKCPEISGSIYNDGCPIDSTNIDKINFQDNKQEVDPNHTEEKVEDIKETQKPNDLQDGTQIEQLENTKYLDRLTVYFNSDDATVSETYDQQIMELAKKYDFSDGSKYRIVVVGHTDNDGSEDYNLILSKKRAETVRRKLEGHGAHYDQIEVFYYGEWKALKSNNNEERKRFNRRVEIRIILK